MNAASFDAVIVGGGIVGAATAAACARTGMQVALVERDVLGGGATAAGMGHIVVMDDSEAQFELTRYSQLLWSRIAPELPASAEYEMPGTLWLAADDEEMAEAERKQKFYRDRNVPARLIDRAENRGTRAEPQTASQADCLFLKMLSSIRRRPRFTFAHLAEDLGATLLLQRSVTAMGNGRVLLDDGHELTAPYVINATGAWAPQLTGDIPVKKRKGHLVITDRYPGYVRHQLVELGYLKSAHSVASDSVAFNVQPRKTGQILIGSSRQYGDESCECRPGDSDCHVAKSDRVPAVRSVPSMPSVCGRDFVLLLRISFP